MLLTKLLNTIQLINHSLTRILNKVVEITLSAMCIVDEFD